MKSYRIMFEHREGDGMMTVATGRASGTYYENVGADSVREAVRTFEACHRHGDTLLGVEELPGVIRCETKCEGCCRAVCTGAAKLAEEKNVQHPTPNAQLSTGDGAEVAHG
jgi:hypothetical protein